MRECKTFRWYYELAAAILITAEVLIIQMKYLELQIFHLFVFHNTCICINMFCVFLFPARTICCHIPSKIPCHPIRSQVQILLQLILRQFQVKSCAVFQFLFRGFNIGHLAQCVTQLRLFIDHLEHSPHNMKSCEVLKCCNGKLIIDSLSLSLLALEGFSIFPFRNSI